jgi:hypothetical protein
VVRLRGTLSQARAGTGLVSIASATPDCILGGDNFLHCLVVAFRDGEDEQKRLVLPPILPRPFVPATQDAQNSAGCGWVPRRGG